MIGPNLIDATCGVGLVSLACMLIMFRKADEQRARELGNDHIARELERRELELERREFELDKARAEMEKIWRNKNT